MRLLFSVNNFGFLRNFEPALRLLAARGHDLHLVADRKDSVGGMRTVEALQRDYPDRVTHAYAPGRKDEHWQPLAVQVRLCLDYWRYLDPRFDHSPSLRARAATQAPAFASRLPRWSVIGSRPAMAAWRAIFRAVERAMPAPASIERLLRDWNPDLLLLTPLLYFGSQQVEYVRAARARGIRTVLGVGSWDHLTTKGLIHEIPDRVLVWNAFQKQEAAELHGVDPSRVVVTGAQAYDHWFIQQPATSREAFCARVGVPADRPLVLYLCSSPFITPYEVGFVRRWIAAVRGHADPALARASILIRPHPQNAAQWRDVDVSSHEAVGIWPREGANPVDTDARAGYFDSMYHSVAMVGMNTSALIESGIVGRPVFTVLAEEFSGQQDGTLHFQHLRNVNGGLLHVGATLDEHLVQLAGAVRGEHDASKSRAFVQAFIRPHGLDVPAAERFVEAIESEVAAPRPTPVRERRSLGLRRLFLRPLASLLRAAAPRKKRGRREDGEPVAAGPMRLLFVLASPEYLRYYDSTMKLLADRGHQVMVAVSWLRERKQARLQLVDDPRITVLGAVPKRVDVWTPFARYVRGTMDFVRYLDPRFAGTPVLRARMYRKALPALLRPLDRIRSLSRPALARVLRVLQAAERAVPVGSRVRDFLDEHRADAVIVSPLVDASSDQVDTVRAARAAGVPVAAAIASWDNLTNKGHMRVEPDLVTVWNEHQRTEAVELHGIRAERVAVTGAQVFDRWFERTPSRPRDAFCAMAGLPDARPFVLFTGSSVFIARSEVEVPFVRHWIAALRAAADPALSEAAVLVRPHPFNWHAWADADFSDLGPVAIWPRGAYTPADEAARTSFFDSLSYSAAVVGINTSAMIEAAILRRPVLSLLTPDFTATQEGTLHFRYLLPENGGFLRIASSIEAHVEQLSAVLRDPETTRAETDRFVRSFLRPHGLDAPCTPMLADALDALARTGRRAPERDTAGTWLLRAGLFPFIMAVFFAARGDAFRIYLRRGVYEAYFQAARASKILRKRLIVHPARLVRAAAASMARRGRLGARRIVGGGAAVRRAALRGGRWTLRSVRQARYHVGMRLRGRAIPDADTSDAPR
ncbi:MAG: hypothetical protein ACRD26_12035 [Vicinamibacterales bacterium]